MILQVSISVMLKLKVTNDFKDKSHQNEFARTYLEHQSP